MKDVVVVQNFLSTLLSTRVWLTQVVFGQQWSYTAQRKTMYQSLDTESTIYCCFWSFHVLC